MRLNNFCYEIVSYQIVDYKNVSYQIRVTKNPHDV